MSYCCLVAYLRRVNGTLPEDVQDELQRRGIPYRPRDGSSRELES
jgi:transcription elongation factor SPT4